MLMYWVEASLGAQKPGKGACTIDPWAIGSKLIPCGCRYSELSWDVVEPVTYFTSQLWAILGYCYFLVRSASYAGVLLCLCVAFEYQQQHQTQSRSRL